MEKTKLVTLSKWLIDEWDNCFVPYNTNLENEFKRLFNYGVYEDYQPPPTSTLTDDVMAEFRANGRDTEYCPDTEDEPPRKTMYIPNYVQQRRSRVLLPVECVFCRNNGKPYEFYRGHILKDKNGIVTCPVLRAYQCPICHDSGDRAHTVKYCPLNKSAFY